MISVMRFTTRRHSASGPRGPEVLDVIDPSRPSPPVGILCRLAGPIDGWVAYVGQGRARRLLGTFANPPDGGPTGKLDALAAIAKAL